MNNVLIIAEAGVNYNCSLELACRMVDLAKEAGADIVKFQTAHAENVISKYAEKAVYQKETTGSSESQLDMVKKLMLPFEEFVSLKEYCENRKISFLSTPFELDAVHFLNGLQNIWKIPSGEITNYPYLIEIAKTGKPVILSTGMSSLEEVETAYNLLRDNGSGEISLLHCTTEYPAPIRDVNLRAMITLKHRFNCPVGYSDHTLGIEVPIAAVAMGAKIIEKHFTLDRNMEGPDHKASLEPDELKAMVKAIRNIENALGDGIKRISESERKNINIARKSIVARRYIKQGEVFTEDNITTKRPGNGLSPMLWPQIMGKQAVRDFQEDELIELQI